LAHERYFGNNNTNNNNNNGDSYSDNDDGIKTRSESAILQDSHALHYSETCEKDFSGQAGITLQLSSRRPLRYFAAWTAADACFGQE
jgi:hypothetical protein